MADQTTIERPSNLDDFATSKTGQNNKIDKEAEKAAEKAGKREKKYDESHDIFTK